MFLYYLNYVGHLKNKHPAEMSGVQEGSGSNHLYYQGHLKNKHPAEMAGVQEGSECDHFEDKISNSENYSQVGFFAIILTNEML